jgi:hypothetical protein
VSTTRDHPLRLVKIKACTLHFVPFFIPDSLKLGLIQEGQQAFLVQLVRRCRFLLLGPSILLPAKFPCRKVPSSVGSS